MQRTNLLLPPSPEDKASFSASFGQRFIVTVDVEEEFDWDAPLERHAHSLNTVGELRKFQQFCEEFQVCPIYLIDWPVASDPQIHEILGSAIASGKGQVGLQLHPWVTPPYDESVNAFNSYAGNLPVELEREKLHQLYQKIRSVFQVDPQIYRAGRYGLGPNTHHILQEIGITIDSSVRAHFDYHSSHGPNYARHPAYPYWADKSRNLLELPLTTVFDGHLRQRGSSLYPRLWRSPAMRGLLAKIGWLERIPLSPEGTTAAEAIRAINLALEQNISILTFSFHSPSLAPGYTPYVRTPEDVEAIYAWWRHVFAHLARKNIRCTTPQEIMKAVEIKKNILA